MHTYTYTNHTTILRNQAHSGLWAVHTWFNNVAMCYMYLCITLFLMAVLLLILGDYRVHTCTYTNCTSARNVIYLFAYYVHMYVSIFIQICLLYININRLKITYLVMLNSFPIIWCHRRWSLCNINEIIIDYTYWPINMSDIFIWSSSVGIW